MPILGDNRMKSTILFITVLLLTVIMVPSLSHAGKFDPLFRVISINGDCTLKTPSSDKFEVAIEGKAYPYGTQIQTHRNSSLVIVLSDGNECQVLANADLILTEDAADPKLKIIDLRTGQVEISLEREFEENNGLNVQTPVAICGAISCKYNIDVRMEQDMLIGIFRCLEGKINIDGHQFNVDDLDADDWISVSASLDREFLRLKSIKGTFPVRVKDSNGDAQNIELKINSTVKIWQQRADIGNNVVVTILFLAPDGKTVEHAFNYTSPDPRTPEELAKLKIKIQDAKKDKEKNDKDAREIVTTTTTTTTTVTTTTIPSGTVPGIITPTTPVLTPRVPDTTPKGRR